MGAGGGEGGGGGATLLQEQIFSFKMKGWVDDLLVYIFLTAFYSYHNKGMVCAMAPSLQLERILPPARF